MSNSRDNLMTQRAADFVGSGGLDWIFDRMRERYYEAWRSTDPLNHEALRDVHRKSWLLEDLRTEILDAADFSNQPETVDGGYD